MIALYLLKKIPFAGSIASCVFPSPCADVTAEDLRIKKIM